MFGEVLLWHQEESAIDAEGRVNGHILINNFHHLPRTLDLAQSIQKVLEAQLLARLADDAASGGVQPRLHAATLLVYGVNAKRSLVFVLVRGNGGDAHLDLMLVSGRRLGPVIL